jgi:hypothetical protein
MEHPELVLGVVGVIVGLVAAVIERRREREDASLRERFAVLEATIALRLETMGERIDALDDQVVDLAQVVASVQKSPGRRA